MAIMTAQLPLTLVPAGAVEIGQVACLVEDPAGGRVFAGVNWSSRGTPVMSWAGGLPPCSWCGSRVRRPYESRRVSGHHRDPAALGGSSDRCRGGRVGVGQTWPQRPLATEPGSGRRYPGSPPQRRPAAAASPDIGDHFLAQSRGAFGATFARPQRGHPDIGHCSLPAPQGLGGDPETLRDSYGLRTLDPHQLHGGKPPAQLITGVPREDQFTTGEDPASGRVLHQTGHLSYLDCAFGLQSQWQLSRHDRHRSLPQYWSETPY